jgi:hypothetical protein
MEVVVQEGSLRRRFVVVRNPGQAVRKEEKLDGKFLLSTTDPSLNAENIALAYKQLAEVERASRTLKHTLELRPFNHRLPEVVDTTPLTAIAGRPCYDWLCGDLFVYRCRTPAGRSGQASFNRAHMRTASHAILLPPLSRQAARSPKVAVSTSRLPLE